VAGYAPATIGGWSSCRLRKLVWIFLDLGGMSRRRACFSAAATRAVDSRAADTGVERPAQHLQHVCGGEAVEGELVGGAP
jgi:hypothetical protein